MADWIDLGLNSPWLNAAGTLGFAPQESWNWPEAQGAFVTNPISLKPRTPAESRILIEYPGGCLLHTGWPNPGLSAVLKKYAARWARSSLPVWVHLIGDQPNEINEMVRLLETAEGVLAVEISLPLHASESHRVEIISAALGELPVIAALPINEFTPEVAGRIASSGITALNLSAPRGRLPGPVGRLVSGRLYGASLFPLILATIQSMSQTGIPLMASTGIQALADGQTLLSSGAAAVSLDVALWG